MQTYVVVLEMGPKNVSAEFGGVGYDKTGNHHNKLTFEHIQTERKNKRVPRPQFRP